MVQQTRDLRLGDEKLSRGILQDIFGGLVMKNLFNLLIVIIFLIQSGSAFAKHLNNEKYYQCKWCNANAGTMEVVLDDGARVDCLTGKYAVEFDFASKWAESIGQSLYYSIKTNRKPAVVLIMEQPAREKPYYKRLVGVAQKYGITVFVMNSKEVKNGK